MRDIELVGREGKGCVVVDILVEKCAVRARKCDIEYAIVVIHVNFKGGGCSARRDLKVFDDVSIIDFNVQQFKIIVWVFKYR